MNSRILVRERQAGSDGMGQPVDSWQEVARLWADIKYQSGVSTIRAGAETSAAKVSMRVWKRAGIVRGMQVVHAGVVYEIAAVLPDLRENKRMDLVCEVIQ